MKEEKIIQNKYAKWSIIYDSILDKIFSFDRELVIDNLDLKDEEKIIEIGVGTGLNSKHYPKKKIKIIGIDFSKEMIDKAIKKNKNKCIFFICGNVINLPYKNNFFDKALGTFVLRVIPESKKVLKELSRVIKPKGLLVLCDSMKSNSKKLNIFSKFTFFLGFGKDINIEEEINGTSWKILSQIKLKKSNSYIIKLINNK